MDEVVENLDVVSEGQSAMIVGWKLSPRDAKELLRIGSVRLPNGCKLWYTASRTLVVQLPSEPPATEGRTL